MLNEILTVEQAAQHLSLHPKTLLRHIRQGRLPATRIGKAYRIARHDLDAFAGQPRATPPLQPRTTSIIDLPEYTADTALALSTALHARLANREQGAGRLRLDSAYDPVRRELKLILVGDLADVSALLDSLQRLLEAQQ
ncbi:MAG: hypothetical protein GAK45_01646 [Pseudomonas citronellolis]|nr:MAG: hypothetical protein GAK45_01646 [Pseudomonas citronellolis]